MTIDPHHDFDVMWIESQNEDGDDEETFLLAIEYRYDDWSVDTRDAGKVLLDYLLNPVEWFRGTAYRDMVGGNEAPFVIQAFLQQTIDRREEITAALGSWDTRIKAIEDDAKRRRDAANPAAPPSP